MATLTQISNILNLMVQHPQSGLKFYHWGYRYDINKEISNNFDPNNAKGRLYPALQMDVPNVFNDLKEPSFDSVQQDIEMVLYFDDLQGYSNNGSIDTRNIIEQFRDLQEIARIFLANLVDVLAWYNAGFIKTNPRFTPRSNLHNDKLITLESVFTLTTQLECIDEANRIDLNNLPATVSKVDIENWKA